MNLQLKKICKKDIPGFTFIELLVIIGILAILLSVILIAINPLEQFNKTNDVATEIAAHDFVSAINYYFTYNKTLPWNKDGSCRQELTTGKTISDMPNCTSDLTGGGQLQASVISADESKAIYVTECHNAVAVCYTPKSKIFNQDSQVKYTKNGVLEHNCPNSNGTSSNCYACAFSTNDGQECFQALNPNGSLAIVPSPSPKQLLPLPTRNTRNACSSSLGTVSCMAKVVSDTSGNPLSSYAPPAGFGPLQIHTAYNLPCAPGGPVQAICPTPSIFGPQTVAIVDAFQAPTIENDLGVFDTTYGIPPCTIANGCLTIINQNGAISPLPPVDPNWALEASLDVEMAHAVCQTCRILFVEANSNSFSDIGNSVNEAASKNPTSISNSYGAPEFFGETGLEQYYNHPGIYVTASSGDWGYGAYYPAASKNVIAVGGTTLSLYDDNTYSSESVWGGTGSGCSSAEIANSFQTSLPNWSQTGCGIYRSIADVSAVADPNTGVSVYDSTAYFGQSGWWIVGGTSVSSPLVSAALALSGNVPTGIEAATLVYANSQKFRDIFNGSNGNCSTIECVAGIGYDGPTGLGSPNFGSSSILSTPTPTVTLSPLQPQVWVMNGYNNSNYEILRINTDGTQSLSPIKTNYFVSPGELALVGSQIWAVDNLGKKIYRFNKDGTSAGSISGISFQSPRYVTVVGSQAWVVDGGRILRLNFDGTTAAPPIASLDPSNISNVGSEVWVTSLFYGYNTIYRYKTDGSSAGNNITGGNLDWPQGITVVGSKIWVTNELNNTILQYNIDGTSAGPTVKGNGLNAPYGIVTVGSQIWVTDMDASAISRFNPDGTPAGNLLKDANYQSSRSIIIVPQK